MPFTGRRGVKFSDADISAAGEELVNEGKKRKGQVASSIDARDLAGAARDINGYSTSFAVDLVKNYLTAAEWASIFDHPNLSKAKGSDILEDTNLSISKINDIITHDNISDSRAQERLNTTDYGTRDLTAANSVIRVFGDDWEDNTITDRDDRATTAAANLGANEFAQKFRPEWTAGSGKASASEGTLKTPDIAISPEVFTPSDFTVGTWEIDFRWMGTVGDYGAGNFRFIFQDSDNLWRIYRVDSSNDEYKLGKVDGGTVTGDVISTTHAHDEDWHDWKVTRDSDGNWELFYDGASDGTSTDTFLPDINELRIRGHSSDSADKEWDNLKVH